MTLFSLYSQRRRLTVQGTVQGVGFRPLVYQLATTLNLMGGVKNTPQGVVIDIEGKPALLELFLQQLQRELPPHAAIQSLMQEVLPTRGLSQFQIWPSESNGKAMAIQILPDLATCPICLGEVLDMRDRRYQYPFTNCTHCGPRFSIMMGLPYDRPRTTMAGFAMCPDCDAEYGNPGDRRFHAQPIACPRCGPHLEYWMGGQRQLGNPLQQAIAVLRQGEIVAIKGLGGFQLFVDAQNSDAVERLRHRKQRPDKPLALMYPTLAKMRRDCEISAAATTLLTSPQAPIVLLPKRPHCSELAPNLALHNPYLGAMLPTTPLHHLLLCQYGGPLVATSGNRSGEPICIDEQVAQQTLGAIADGFLVHNRPIQRPVDDSVGQIVRGQAQILRQARGYSPQAIQLTDSGDSECCVLALGAQFKNAIALALGNQVVLSQHIGDLDTPQAVERLQQTVADFINLYQCQPTAVACDRHPDYSSTWLAQTIAHQWEVPLISVQHHYAHVLSAMTEHQLHPPVLGIAWDGTGYGSDQTIWGGEFLRITEVGFERVAHFRPFPLPGGDICSREPQRSALGLLYACYGKAAFAMTELAPLQAFSETQRLILQRLLANSINTPMTSSVGRLFDGVAALLNLHQSVSFEGQAAMALEFAAQDVSVVGAYPFTLSTTQPYEIDWEPMVRSLIQEQLQKVPSQAIAAKFHRTLGDIAIAISQRVAITQVVLTGGCFQNRHLSEQTIQLLSNRGFMSYWHQRIPPNDGGIAVGQAIAARRYLAHPGVEPCA